MQVQVAILAHRHAQQQGVEEPLHAARVAAQARRQHGYHLRHEVEVLLQLRGDCRLSKEVTRGLEVERQLGKPGDAVRSGFCQRIADFPVVVRLEIELREQ